MTILPGAGAYWFEGNDVGCLLVHGFDKANGPFILDSIGSSAKHLLALPDSSHEVTLDVDRERVMVEVYDVIRAHSKA
jgi:hypothetical protein